MSEPAVPPAPVPGADLAPAAAFVLGRAERNRLVIFDPSSVGLFRPLIAPDDLRPWHAAPADRWALAIPPGYTAGLPDAAGDEAAAFAALAAAHPAVARHLRPHTPATARRPTDGGWWWEVAAPSLPPGPRILLGPGVAAWDDSGALVAAPIAVIPAADPFWLALLWAGAHGSKTTAALGPPERPQDSAPPAAGATGPSPGAEPLAAFGPAWYASIPAPARASLGGLALSAANIAAQVAAHERAVLRRLLADFGPPGAAASPRLTRWWELSFPELRAELVAALRNDIPERFRPTWEQTHTQQRADREAALAQLAAAEAAIDAQLAALL